MLNTLETIKRRLVDLKVQAKSDLDIISELVESDDLGEEYSEYVEETQSNTLRVILTLSYSMLK